MAVESAGTDTRTVIEKPALGSAAIVNLSSLRRAGRD